MAAGTGVVYIEQYAKWEAVFFLYQDANKTIPFDMTGYTNPRMQIRDRANSDIVIAEPTLTFGEYTDVKNNTFTAIFGKLTAAETGLILASGQTYQEVSNYIYDVLVDDPGGEPIRLFNDYAKVSPGVTR